MNLIDSSGSKLLLKPTIFGLSLDASIPIVMRKNRNHALSVFPSELVFLLPPIYTVVESSQKVTRGYKFRCPLHCVLES